MKEMVLIIFNKIEFKKINFEFIEFERYTMELLWRLFCLRLKIE